MSLHRIAYFSSAFEDTLLRNLFSFGVKMDYNMLRKHEYRPYCNVVTVQEIQ